MTGTSSALHSLLLALEEPLPSTGSPSHLRWRLRQRMAAVRDGLANEPTWAGEGWLAARSGAVLRERQALLARLAALGPAVLESPDLDRVRGDLRRLAADIARHCQRLHDLVYDEVELELGGSE